MPQARRRKKDEQPEQLEPEEGADEVDEDEPDEDPDGDEQPDQEQPAEQEDGDVDGEESQDGGEDDDDDGGKESMLPRPSGGGTVTVTIEDDVIGVEVPRDNRAGHLLRRVAKLVDDLP